MIGDNIIPSLDKFEIFPYLTVNDPVLASQYPALVASNHGDPTYIQHYSSEFDHSTYDYTKVVIKWRYNEENKRPEWGYYFKKHSWGNEKTIFYGRCFPDGTYMEGLDFYLTDNSLFDKEEQCLKDAIKYYEKRRDKEINTLSKLYKIKTIEG